MSGLTQLREGASLLSAIGTLSLGVLALRVRKSQLARAIAALCFVLFGWNIAVVAQGIVRSHPAFAVLDAVSTALTPPLVLEVVLVFIGEASRRRSARLAAWAYFGPLAVASLGGLFSGTLLAWIDGGIWAGWFLAGWLVTFVYELVLLGRYLRSTAEVIEKARARSVLAALVFGGACSTSDVAHSLGLPTPSLAALGTFVAAALLLSLVVRHDLLDRRVSRRAAIYAVVMISALLVAYLVVLSAFAGRLGVQLLCASLITLAAAAIARELALSLAEARADTQRLALLGRFSAQMAHDIKGPLTALLGAVQLLEGEGESEYLPLVSEQARRIGRIVDRYDRMARIEPQRTLVSMQDLARAIGRAHGVEVENGGEDRDLDADRALVEAALENVVRNALDATGNASFVRIRTNVEGDAAVFRVVDQGRGMDARVLARATEDFFSTKANGSGLGLTFAKRVAEAHGGSLALKSRRGEGTIVTIALPLSASLP